MRTAEEKVAIEQRAVDRALRSLSSQANFGLVASGDPYTQQLDLQAAEVYMQGPLAGIDGMLSSTPTSTTTSPTVPISPTVSSGGVKFASTSGAPESEVVSQAALNRPQLARNMAAETPLLAHQEAAGLTANGSREALNAAFAAQQAALSSLASTRLKVLAAVQKLHSRLTPREIASANACTGAGVPITYGRWAGRFLKAIGAPVSQNNLVAMVAWQSAEGTMASWNPLATTYSMPGATAFNSVGVRNYTSLEQGIQAIVFTLQSPGHGYENILADLRASADPAVTAGAINASDWCSGCAGGQYVLDLIPTVQQYFGQFAAG